MEKDLQLTASLLPASLINKNFVKGEANCNYEIYLIELLNNSNWFSAMYPGVFYAPKSESAGECDANNEYYHIDFKLFASESALRARNLLSYSISKTDDGAVVYGVSKKLDTTLKYTRIFAAFRGKSVDELVRIRNASTKKDDVDNDIKSVLQVLETKKNLLLFFPYVFKFKENIIVDNAIKIIKDALNSDYKAAFDYRHSVLNNFDTYFACIYMQFFLIFQVVGNKMVFIDQINTNLLPTYKKLYDYSVFWAN